MDATGRKREGKVKVPQGALPLGNPCLRAKALKETLINEGKERPKRWERETRIKPKARNVEVRIEVESCPL